jgi:hypothetical protein
MSIPQVSKKWLYHEYITKNRTAEDIGKELGCSKSNVSYLANIKYGFHKRYRVEKGSRFGKLVVIDPYYTQANSGHPVCLCKCDCGNEFKVRRYCLTTNNTRSCGCLRSNQSPEHEHVSKRFWKTLRTNALNRGLSLNVTIQEIWQLFEKQNRQCALSGLNLQMNHTASLDRIDNNKNYTLDNIQWVHKHINRIKMDLNQQYFIELCQTVTEHVSRKGV